MQNQITTEIGTELLFENDRIRVWQMVLQPGEESPHHRHESDYVFVYTTPSRMTAFLEGQEDNPSRLGPGDMIALPACAPHVFRTHGDQTLRILGIHASPARIVNVVSDPSATL